MPPGLYSEVGRLRTVPVCRPGLAQKRLTPANCHELLFNDVPWVAQARNDHEAFNAALKDRDIQVLEMHDLLADTVALPTARQWLLDRKLGPPVYSRAQADALGASRQWVMVADGDGWRRVAAASRCCPGPMGPACRA